MNICNRRFQVASSGLSLVLGFGAVGISAHAADAHRQTTTANTPTSLSPSPRAQADKVVDLYLEQILCSNVSFKIWKEGLYQAGKSPIPEADLRNAFSENLFYSLMPGQERSEMRSNVSQIFSKTSDIAAELSDIAVFFSSTIHELFERENQSRRERGQAPFTKEDFITEFGKGNLALKHPSESVSYKDWLDKKINRISGNTESLRYGCAGNRNFIYRANSRLGSVVDLDAFVIPATNASAKRISEVAANLEKTTPTHAEKKSPQAALLANSNQETIRRAEQAYPPRSLTVSAQDMVGATFYFTANERDPRYAGPKTHNILDDYGNVVARVSEAFYKAVNTQGSGKLASGQVINATKKRSGILRFMRTNATYGLGKSGNHLVPWRSIAIDAEYYSQRGIKVEIGQRVFIPSTRGMLIPGSSPAQYHDGYWEVADKGGAIKNARIDLFTGFMHWKDALGYVNKPANYNTGKRNAEAERLGSSSKSVTMQFVK